MTIYFFISGRFSVAIKILILRYGLKIKSGDQPNLKSTRALQILVTFHFKSQIKQKAFYVGQSEDQLSRLSQPNHTKFYKSTTFKRPWEQKEVYEISEWSGETIKIESLLKTKVEDS